MTRHLPAAPASRDPQVRSAYADFLALTSAPEPGFPRAVAVREWVPGLSGAPGALAVSAVAVWMPTTAPTAHVDQVVHTIMTSAMLAVSAGLPVLSVWFGYRLTRP